ncbi:hypothetical protein M5X00_23220 [Paenibacillus alvei]|nr:hypothetical protein [Paenibacillus alvei]EJW14317.1 hypothetical protein PAV_14c00100 [Paenibacillus alvei DSM 29]MCY9541868.1 hypothetical protein [Paenibacillus alvei]MCY9737311.1 hypothetical protein [Paenibacillus alvei]MCY9757153.1 hypothetical protein [Paenibacillus alvei]MEC0084442.1 hypothetical protein [Paenibacillus alvei]
MKKHIFIGKFNLGTVVITPGASDICEDHVLSALTRHISGDWGDVCEEDKQENDYSLAHGGRLLSSYRSAGVKFWIITEHDRSITTILLPEEY